MKNISCFKKVFCILMGGLALLWFNAASVMATSDIEVGDAWVRATPPEATNSAAYLMIHNYGSEDDVLLSVHSHIAEAVELHNVVKKGAMISMDPVESIKIPSGDFVELKPKSYHITLSNLKETLKVGSEVAFTLKFKHAGAIKLKAKIRESQSVGHDHSSHDHGNGHKKKKDNHSDNHGSDDDHKDDHSDGHKNHSG